MTDAQTAAIKKLTDAMHALSKRRFSLSMTERSDGSFAVDVGEFGNANLVSFNDLELFLNGIVMGMNMNRG
jgi:hypothetical protein